MIEMEALKERVAILQGVITKLVLRLNAHLLGEHGSTLTVQEKEELQSELD